jgi:hypothetical protein
MPIREIRFLPIRVNQLTLAIRRVRFAEEKNYGAGTSYRHESHRSSSKYGIPSARMRPTHATRRCHRELSHSTPVAEKRHLSANFVGQEITKLSITK